MAEEPRPGGGVPRADDAVSRPRRLSTLVIGRAAQSSRTPVRRSSTTTAEPSWDPAGAEPPTTAKHQIRPCDTIFGTHRLWVNPALSALRLAQRSVAPGSDDLQSARGRADRSWAHGRWGSADRVPVRCPGSLLPNLHVNTTVPSFERHRLPTLSPARMTFSATATSGDEDDDLSAVSADEMFALIDREWGT